MTATTPPPPPSLLFFNGLLILAFLSIPFLALRILFLLPPLRPPPRPRKRPGALPSSNPKPSTPSTPEAASDPDDDAAPAPPTHLVVVLGSGGHTAEMLAMLRGVDRATFLASWTRRTYVVSAGDALSAERARDFEASLAASSATTSSYAVRTVPRARRVHQPLLSTPLSALRCLAAVFALLCDGPAPPDLVLTNGPGTGVVVVLAALLWRFVDVGDVAGTSRVRTVYVESWARDHNTRKHEMSQKGDLA
ncbi:putative glycosyltransferase family protein [Neofusicoccum parvum UCRNP2]|uniref:UDP-N-acetylglucosamine transferase subunit ALG14 n=1 Tax=Botryosphaeria parva (strain UCR-NP2) TaxID=1287680 RepID=R1EQQ1_BOTPV|nr:putative glycosyltransferase family protein [Neofusicoccum parvum UCRNP2]